MDTELLALLAGLVAIATMVAKPAINLIRIAVELPRWAPPALAYAISVVAILLAFDALGLPVARQQVSQALLASVAAAVVAVGDVQLQRKADEVDVDRKTVNMLTKSGGG